MNEPSKSPSDSRDLMLRVLGEYVLKGMVVATACALVLLAVIAFLKQQGSITIEQVIIISGLGYTAASRTFFGGKDPKEKQAKR